MKFSKLILFKIIPLCLLVWNMMLINGSHAQGTLQVATKTIEKTVRSSSVRTLHINAEKADIEIITWEKTEIAIIMELSARHTEKSVATEDLFKVKYIADKSGKDFFLRNYIVLKDGENKPASNIKARYTIHLPASCAVNLKNTFGTITLKGLTNNLQLKADFCTTYLSGIAGKGLLQTTFGELKGIEISGVFTFSSDHTNLELESIAGEMKLDALYGNVRINPSTNLSSLTIHSKKAEVTLVTKNWQNFDYHINSAYTTVKLPNGFKWKRNTTDFKDAFFSKNQLSQVQINAEFGNLTIK